MEVPFTLDILRPLLTATFSVYTVGSAYRAGTKALVESESVLATGVPGYLDISSGALADTLLGQEGKEMFTLFLADEQILAQNMIVEDEATLARYMVLSSFTHRDGHQEARVVRLPT